MKAYLGKHIFSLLLFLLPFALVLIWFRDGRIIGGGDELLPFINTDLSLQIFSSTWMNYGTGFAVIFWLSRFPFFYLINILHTTFQLPGFFLQAGTYYLLMVTGVLSMYFIIKQYLSGHAYKEYVAVLAGFFYLMNPYSMSQVWGRGQYPQFFSFAWLPLSLLIFTIGIRRRKYIYSIQFALVSILFSTSYGFLPFSIVQWAMLSLFVLYGSVNTYKNKKVDFFPVRFFLFSLAIWVFVHTWWLVPLLLSGPSILGVNLQNAKEGVDSLVGLSQSYPFPIIIRLLQSFYFFSEHAYSPYYSILRYQLMSWIPVICLFAGVYSILRWKSLTQLRIFVIFLLTGLIISLGANPPTGSSFIFIFERIPFLQMFRNPYEKAGLLYVLGYAPIFAIGMVTLLDFFRKKLHISKAVVVSLGLLVILLINIYLWPMWTGRIVAGPDGKIGVSVPQYLSDYINWLGKNNGDYRVLMTPLWKGEGAIYDWSGLRYQGVDPYILLTHQEEVGSSARSPYYYDFAQSLLQYMQQVDTRPATALLRVKYLVNRHDAILVTQNEKEQYRYLSEVIYPVSEKQTSIKCDKDVENIEDGTVICDIHSSRTDWKNLRYLGMNVKADIPSTFELSAVDNANNRLVWDGRGLPSYQLDGLNWNSQLLPLYAPTSQNESFDRSNVTRLEIKAHPLPKPGENVKKLQVQDIYLNEGEKKNISEFLPETQFGKLTVYKPTTLIVPPEFGLLSETSPVTDYLDLFETALEERKRLDSTGFIMISQNIKKDIKSLSQTSSAKIVERTKVSDTKYWIKLSDSSDAYVLLSKTFYPGWKIVSGADKTAVNGSFFNNLRLLTIPVLPESSHFVVNGYANLWKVYGNNTYAIVFIPELVAEIGKQISIVTVFTLLVIIVSFYFEFIKNLLISIKRKLPN